MMPIASKPKWLAAPGEAGPRWDSRHGGVCWETATSSMVDGHVEEFGELTGVLQGIHRLSHQRWNPCRGPQTGPSVPRLGHRFSVRRRW